jgi:hypothetical protein
MRDFGQGVAAGPTNDLLQAIESDAGDGSKAKRGNRQFNPLPAPRGKTF